MVCKYCESGCMQIVSHYSLPSFRSLTTAYLEYAPQILNELWMEWYADNVNANQKHGFDWVDQDAQGYPVICDLSIYSMQVIIPK